MSNALLFLRAVRGHWAIGVALGGIAFSTTSVALIPDDWIYNYVPSVGPGVFGTGITAILVAVVLALPRLEASEVTAFRPLWWHRLWLVLGIGGFLTVLATTICIAAGSFYFFIPVLRGGITVASATLLAAVFVPARYVAVVGLAYIFACYYGHDGSAWWDLLLSPPTTTNLLLALGIGSIGAGVFAWRGAKQLAPDDEY